MKKIVIMLLLFACSTSLQSCTSISKTQIYMISREEGSGTRSAFAHVFGVLDENGIDAVSGRAEKVTSTATVIYTVAGNKNAIGYVSLSTLDNRVKALSIDGISPNEDNIRSGKYKVTRPFVICFSEDKLSATAKDFISYINSAEGQKIISESGYIPASMVAREYKANNASGKITFAGSTSVAPIIEGLADEYKKINKNVEIEIQQSGSGAGIQSVSEGACDIGMSSRNLTLGELKSLRVIKIADDGIAVIVNKSNVINNMSGEAVKNIYLGNITDWIDVY